MVIAGQLKILYIHIKLIIHHINSNYINSELYESTLRISTYLQINNVYFYTFISEVYFKVSVTYILIIIPLECLIS